MNGAAKTAFIMVAVGFPVYLLWRGTLRNYMTLAGGPILSGMTGSGATAPPVTLGNSASGTTTTYGPMGVPTGPVSASGLQNVPITGGGL